MHTKYPSNVYSYFQDLKIRCTSMVAKHGQTLPSLGGPRNYEFCGPQTCTLPVGHTGTSQAWSLTDSRPLWTSLSVECSLTLSWTPGDLTWPFYYVFYYVFCSWHPYPQLTLAGHLDFSGSSAFLPLSSSPHQVGIDLLSSPSSFPLGH